MAAPDIPADPADLKIPKTFPSIVVPNKLTGEAKKVLTEKKLIASIEKFNVVRPDENGRRILLAEGVDSLPEDVKAVVGDIEITPFTCELDYHNMTLPELLRYYIPEPIVISTAFETIGHVAHLNLLEQQLPYKNIIGKAIILKNPSIKTVATKTGAINNIYRNMDLEVIAGEDNFITEVHQSGLTFKMDFSKVYWNSRLQHEHDSVVETFVEGALVADAMCGIGPFAVRAALRKKCHVKANDLNPDSYHWLQENCRINKVGDAVECFNMDAREFIRKVFDEGGCDYLVMNLPGTAVEFLDAVGEAASKNKDTARMPVVIFHAFDQKDGDYEGSLRRRAETALGLKLPAMDIKTVRDVAPGKFMYRCSFCVGDVFIDGGSGLATV